MVQLIAKKRIGRRKPGDAFKATSYEAGALIALGLAERATPEPTPTVAEQAAKANRQSRREYMRRDMVAEPVTEIVSSVEVVTVADARGAARPTVGGRVKKDGA